MDDDIDWMKQALCRRDPEMWFADKDSLSIRVAAAICRECPVQKQCEEYVQSLRRNLRQGVWAGSIY